MKILHIIDTIKPGGAENVMLNYIKVCNQLGYKSIVLGKRESEQYEKEIANHAEIIEHVSSINFNEINVIFLHSNHAMLKLFKHYLEILKYKPRIIYIQHLNYRKFKFRILSKIINLICTDFIQITPITEEIINKYIRIPIHKIINFYINRYPQEERHLIRHSVREYLNIDNNKIVVVFSAIFKPGKGLKDFLLLAEQLKDYDEYRFLIIGDGEEADLVKESTLKNIIWLGRQNDVEKFLIASDIYVFSSRYALEMMPMALIEAMNVNLPCVSYDLPINNYLLNNQTFNTINKDIIINNLYSDSKDLQHYDESYALKKMEELLRFGSKTCSNQINTHK